MLPTLGAKLHKLSKQVHRGLGFLLIRGLDAANFSVVDLTVVYMGISAHIANIVGRQDGSGNALGQYFL